MEIIQCEEEGYEGQYEIVALSPSGETVILHGPATLESCKAFLYLTLDEIQHKLLPFVVDSIVKPTILGA